MSVPTAKQVVDLLAAKHSKEMRELIESIERLCIRYPMNSSGTATELAMLIRNTLRAHGHSPDLTEETAKWLTSADSGLARDE